MTREEAIKRLIDERDNDIFASDFRDKQHEALTIAIKSLEAWDKVIEEIRETIKKDPYRLYVAIEIINKHLGKVEE